MIVRRSLPAALAALLASSAALAIGNFEPNAGLQFNFSNPGARSLGGAYLGFSDDATAAYTNPAGLAWLGTNEIFLEGRQSNFDTPFVNFRNGAIVQDSTATDVVSPSYFAAVYSGEDWSVAFYRNEELNFENSFAKEEIPVQDGRIFASAHSVDAKIVNFGGSGAYKVNDQLSLGLSVVYSKLDFVTGSIRLRDNGAGALFEVGDDEAWGANAGVLYKWNERWSLGGAYRHGGSYDLNVFVIAPDGSGRRVGTGAFDVPHQYSLGVAYKATDQLAVGFDAHLVQYSRLGNDPLATLFNNQNEFETGIEYRFGGEYLFDTEVPFTLRAGLWRDPAHAYTYAGGTPRDIEELADSILFPEGDDEMHYSIGFGFAFDRAQIDFGADFSELIDTYSVSGGIRF
jgi:long-chain fatty acid transport protein